MEINKVISFVAIIGKIIDNTEYVYCISMQVWQNPATGHSPSRTGRGRVGTSSSSATSSRTSYTWHVTLYTCATWHVLPQVQRVAVPPRLPQPRRGLHPPVPGVRRGQGLPGQRKSHPPAILLETFCHFVPYINYVNVSVVYFSVLNRWKHHGLL